MMKMNQKHRQQQIKEIEHHRNDICRFFETVYGVLVLGKCKVCGEPANHTHMKGLIELFSNIH